MWEREKYKSGEEIDENLYPERAPRSANRQQPQIVLGVLQVVKRHLDNSGILLMAGFEQPHGQVCAINTLCCGFRDDRQSAPREPHQHDKPAGSRELLKKCPAPDLVARVL
jgi:hypothetical protein